MNFASDNWAGVAEPVARALFEASNGLAAAYGTSDLDKAVEARLSEIFERDVSVFFVGTGTAANALSMALVNKPGGIVFCHEAAHLIADECGAVETMTGQARQDDPCLTGNSHRALSAKLGAWRPGDGSINHPGHGSRHRLFHR